MEKITHLKIGAIAAAFLLMGTFAVAQSSHKDRTLKPREGSSGQASGLARTLKPSERRVPDARQRKDGAIAHSDYTRPADQRKNGGIDGGSNAAAHAGARSEAQSKAKAGENPLYEERGTSGTNPMYESQDRLKANPGAPNAKSAQPYKDPEDMTTRFRAGNNHTKRDNVAAPKNGKGENPMYEHDATSNTNPMYESQRTANGSGSNSQSVPSPEEASKKHLGNVKYQNRTAGQQPNKPSSKENFKQDFGQVKASKR